MKRRLFNLAAAVSLGMMLAIVALWVRSYFVSDTLLRVKVEPFPFPPTRSEYAAGCSRGRFYVLIDRWRDLTFKTGDPDGIRLRSNEMSGAQLLVGRGTPLPKPPAAADPRAWMAARTKLLDDWAMAGTRSQSSNPSAVRYPDLGERRLIVPIYLAAMIFAVLPTIAAVGAWRAHRRVPHGRCAICGYDLRATPERCPECGTAAGTAAAAGEARRA
jgi:hypothetical protein